MNNWDHLVDTAKHIVSGDRLAPPDPPSEHVTKIVETTAARMRDGSAKVEFEGADALLSEADLEGLRYACARLNWHLGTCTVGGVKSFSVRRK